MYVLPDVCPRHCPFTTLTGPQLHLSGAATRPAHGRGSADARSQAPIDALARGIWTMNASPSSRFDTTDSDVEPRRLIGQTRAETLRKVLSGAGKRAPPAAVGGAPLVQDTDRSRAGAPMGHRLLPLGLGRDGAHGARGMGNGGTQWGSSLVGAPVHRCTGHRRGSCAKRAPDRQRSDVTRVEHGPRRRVYPKQRGGGLPKRSGDRPKGPGGGDYNRS